MGSRKASNMGLKVFVNGSFDVLHLGHIKLFL